LQCILSRAVNRISHDVRTVGGAGSALPEPLPGSAQGFLPRHADVGEQVPIAVLGQLAERFPRVVAAGPNPYRGEKSRGRPIDPIRQGAVIVPKGGARNA
jgi:hypothetical protein